jgi:uncharacterized protein with LGFP repeats
MWSAATGARATNGAIAAAWVAAGRESGRLGYPSTDMGCGMVGDGCGQQFQGGSVYWTAATGAHPVSGPIWNYWVGQGWERGPLGYAVSDQVCEPGQSSCRQDFQRETVSWSAATGAQTTSGSIRALWLAKGGGGGALGVPSGPMVCGLAAGGCRQPFTGGVVYASAAGTRMVSGPIGEAWTARGAETSALGYPAGELVCEAGGANCRQDFQRETMTWSAGTGAQTTSGSIRAVWLAKGGGGGALGVPAEDMVCGLAAGGCRQPFTGGVVYASAVGTWMVSGPIAAAWTARGAETGALGYPAGELVCEAGGANCRQDFQGETMTWSAATGAQTTSGGIRAAWLRAGGGGGSMGVPTGAMVCGLTADGCRQNFQGGTATWSPATGTRLTNGAIGAVWIEQGREAGPLGYPSTDMGCGMVRDGCGQQFQGGSVYWSPATGAQATSGAIRAAWIAQGWERGTLGFPAAPMTCDRADGGCEQRFEGGTLVWSPVDNKVRWVG